MRSICIESGRVDEDGDEKGRKVNCCDNQKIPDVVVAVGLIDAIARSDEKEQHKGD